WEQRRPAVESLQRDGRSESGGRHADERDHRRSFLSHILALATREEKVMQKHITILGVLYITFGILGVLAGLIVFVSVAGGGIISGDRKAMAITAIVGSAVALFLFLISAPGVIGGIGLLQRRSWARILVL